MGRPRLRGHDLRAVRECHGLIGVDEAGRGALAGPVVAAAVMINRGFLDSDWCRRRAAVINDSKQLTVAQREHILERMEWLMREHRILFAPGLATVAEIERENILGATRLAMRRAIEAVLRLGQIRRHPPDPLFTYRDPPKLREGECITDWRILVDGKPLADFGFAHRGIVGGDGKSLVIAMASIVAKVTRDRLMDALDTEFPGYGFGRHKGYATARHREALLAGGPTAHHRALFIRTFLSTARGDANQAEIEFAESTDEPPAVPSRPVRKPWSRLKEPEPEPDVAPARGKIEAILEES